MPSQPTTPQHGGLALAGDTCPPPSEWRPTAVARPLGSYQAEFFFFFFLIFSLQAYFISQHQKANLGLRPNVENVVSTNAELKSGAAEQAPEPTPRCRTRLPAPGGLASRKRVTHVARPVLSPRFFLILSLKKHTHTHTGSQPAAPRRGRWRSPGPRRAHAGLHAGAHVPTATPRGWEGSGAPGSSLPRPPPPHDTANHFLLGTEGHRGWGQWSPL